MDRSAIMLDFSTFLSVQDRIMTQKARKDTEDLDDTSDQPP